MKLGRYTLTLFYYLIQETSIEPIALGASLPFYGQTQLVTRIPRPTLMGLSIMESQG